jgi:hypothetical protein
MKQDGLWQYRADWLGKQKTAKKRLHNANIWLKFVQITVNKTGRFLHKPGYQLLSAGGYEVGWTMNSATIYIPKS